MRRAQYRISGSGGDAECVVFYFGPGQGGDARRVLTAEEPDAGRGVAAVFRRCVLEIVVPCPKAAKERARLGQGGDEVHDVLQRGGGLAGFEQQPRQERIQGKPRGLRAAPGETAGVVEEPHLLEAGGRRSNGLWIRGVEEVEGFDASAQSSGVKQQGIQVLPQDLGWGVLPQDPLR